jgi:hypothetical protein
MTNRGAVIISKSRDSKQKDGEPVHGHQYDYRLSFKAAIGARRRLLCMQSATS